MSAAILLPYWQNGNPARDRAAALVHAHLERFPGARLEARRTGLQAKTAALNALARFASDAGVLVCNDADTLVPHAQIAEGIRLAAEAPGLVYCYRSYWRLTRAASEALDDPAEIFEPTTEPDLEWHALDPVSTGCVAIRRASFTELGGFDERFGGARFEDMAFAARCVERWPTRRVEGDAFHLWHGARRDDDSPLDTDPDQVAANWRLYRDEYAPRGA